MWPETEINCHFIHGGSYGNGPKKPLTSEGLKVAIEYFNK